MILQCNCVKDVQRFLSGVVVHPSIAYLSLSMQYPVRGPCALKRTASFTQVLFIERHFKRTLSGTGVVVAPESGERKCANLRTVTPLKDIAKLLPLLLE